MIAAHPDADLTQNTIILGAEIIDLLIQYKGEALIDTLLFDFLKSDSKRSPEMFMEAMILLYAMGIVGRRQYKLFIERK